MSVITAPISIGKVANTLGSTSTDLGTLCKASSINKWAKYRPIEHSSVGELTEAERQSKNYGWTIPTYENKTTFKNSYTTRWTANLPEGGAGSCFRLTDFENYTTDTDNWGRDSVSESSKDMRLVFNGGLTCIGGVESEGLVQVSPMDKFNLDIDIESPDGADNLYVYPYDIPSLRNYYLGIVIIQGDVMIVATGDKTIGEAHTAGNTDNFKIQNLSIPSTGLSFVEGAFVAIPCLSRVKSSGTWVEAFSTSRSNEAFITLNGCYMNCQRVSEKLVYSVTNIVISDTLDFRVSIQNPFSDRKSVSTLFALVVSENSWQDSGITYYITDNWNQYAHNINGDVLDENGEVCARYVSIGGQYINGNSTFTRDLWINYTSDAWGSYYNTSEGRNSVYVYLFYYDNVSNTYGYDYFE